MNKNFALSLLLLAAAPLFSAHAQEKSVALLFGPVSADAREKAANTATERIYQWLGAPNTSVELRRAGQRDGQMLLKFLKPKDVTQALSDSARLGAEAPLPLLLDSIDMAAYALARKPGLRFLILALETQDLSPDLLARLKQSADLCKSNNVKVLLWDFSSGAGAAAWENLVSGSGGARDKDLAKLDSVLPSAAPPAAAVAEAAKKAEPEKSPVASYLFRSSPPSAKAEGATVGVMNGDFITEIPMRALKFNTQGGNANARVRVTQTVKNKAGESVWQGKKELTVKRSASKLEASLGGSLVYMRQVKLTRGDYALESAVEDLNAEATLSSTTPAAAADMIPGLAMSSAIIVRQLNKQTDLFEGDDLIQYDGVALIPMLGPAFPASEPFTLSVYFLFFPEINGKQPRLRLDILQNGQSVGGTALPFTDKLRDDTRGGGGSASGEQKHSFPYLAKLTNAMLLAGNYEVKITIQQDSQEVSARIPFRVVELKASK